MTLALSSVAGYLSCVSIMGGEKEIEN